MRMQIHMHKSDKKTLINLQSVQCKKDIELVQLSVFQFVKRKTL